jgi:hypothetical protein
MIPELREAIRLKPRLAATQVGFHLALARTGAFSDAISTIRKATEQGPDSRLDTLDLIWPIALMDQKKELIANLRQLCEALKGEKSSVEWIERVILLAERLVAMGSKLPKVFRGASSSVYPSVCHERRLYALATELWYIAFEVEPALRERCWYLDYAARSAALAGCGEGKDHPLPNGAERAKLRGQALTWFRAEVSATARALDAGAPEVSKDLLRTVDGWRETPDLAGIRDPEALAKLPEAERRSWQALWAEVEALEKRLRAACD